jgi:chromosome segregation ATPase
MACEARCKEVKEMPELHKLDKKTEDGLRDELSSLEQDIKRLDSEIQEFESAKRDLDNKIQGLENKKNEADRRIQAIRHTLDEYDDDERSPKTYIKRGY